MRAGGFFFFSPNAPLLVVVVSQRYQNQSEEAIDSTFVLPVGDWDQHGVVCDWLVEPTPGVEVLADICSQRDALARFRGVASVLLDDILTAGVNEATFCCHVQNLLPGQEVVVRFSFLTLVETSSDGLFTLTLPLSFSARQPYEFEMALDVLEFSDIRSLASPSHPAIAATLLSRKAHVSLREREALLTSPFVLHIESATMLMHVSSGASFVEKAASGDLSALACFRPTFEGLPYGAPVTVLLDGGALATSADAVADTRQLLQSLCASLKNTPRIRVRFVGGAPDHVLTWKVDCKDVEQLLTTAIEASSSGPTEADLHHALKLFYGAHARVEEEEDLTPVDAAQPQPHEKHEQLLLVSDCEQLGISTANLVELVRLNADRHRLFTFGVGHFNRAVLTALASAGRGRAQFVVSSKERSDGALAKRVRALARCMEEAPQAMLVEWGDLNPVLHPFAVYDHGGIFSGDLVFVLATLPASQQTSMEVTLRLVAAAGPEEGQARVVTLMVRVNPRKYLKRDNVSLLAARCVLNDQVCGPDGHVPDAQEVLERSRSVGVAVAGCTSFFFATEDPTNLLAMLSLASPSIPFARSVPRVASSSMFVRSPVLSSRTASPQVEVAPATSAAAAAATTATAASLSPAAASAAAGTRKKASVLDIARAKPKSSAVPVPRRITDDSDDDDTPQQQASLRGAKSMDASSGNSAGAGKRTYDMNSLLKFRQVSLDGTSAISPSSLDIAALSASPTMGKKKPRSRAGTGRSSPPPPNNRSPSSASSPWGGASKTPQLVVGANAWRPKKQDADALAVDIGKMRGILNKVTAEKMEYFIEQILDVGITSAHHLKGLIDLIFERVLSAQSMTPLYAELCFKMSSRCPTFDDPSGEGTGEWSFRRMLLNRCQHEFEEMKAAPTPDPSKTRTAGEELEAEFKAKLRILGNIRFVGELFRLGMLSHTIVIGCVVKLMPLDRLPDPEDLEVLSQLLTTSGAMLDRLNDKTKSFMRECFAKIQQLAHNKVLEARIRFKLQDLIDLRTRGWNSIDKALAKRPRVFTADRSGSPVVVVGGGGAGVASSPPTAAATSVVQPKPVRGSIVMPPVATATAAASKPDAATDEDGDVSPNEDKSPRSSGRRRGTRGSRGRKKTPTGSPRDSRSSSPTAASPLSGSLSGSVETPSFLVRTASSEAPSFLARTSSARTSSARSSQVAKAPAAGASWASQTTSPRESSAETRPPVSAASLTAALNTSPTIGSRRKHHDSAKLEASAKELLEEFLLSYDADEACECIRELDSPGWLHRVIVIAVLLACERGSANERRLMVKLVVQLHKDGLVDASVVMRAFEELIDDLAQLVTDTPTAPAVIGYCLGGVVAAAVLDKGDLGSLAMSLKRCAHGGASSAVVSLLGFVYDALVEGSDPARGLELWRQSGLTLTEMEPNAQVRAAALAKCIHAKAVQ